VSLLLTGFGKLSEAVRNYNAEIEHPTGGHAMGRGRLDDWMQAIWGTRERKQS
jgi:hypothetical protein